LRSSAMCTLVETLLSISLASRAASACCAREMFEPSSVVYSSSLYVETCEEVEREVAGDEVEAKVGEDGVEEVKRVAAHMPRQSLVDGELVPVARGALLRLAPVARLGPLEGALVAQPRRRLLQLAVLACAHGWVRCGARARACSRHSASYSEAAVRE
jgi:hypothetical protein